MVAITVETKGTESATQAKGAKYSRCDAKAGYPIKLKNGRPQTAKADASIAAKVDHALWNNGVLRSTDYREIDVVVKDGVVFLSGHVISTANQKQAEDAARTVPEVLGVINCLIADEDILREVAGGLGKIEHKYGVKFFTGVRNGVIILNGDVDTAIVRSLAEQYAANFPWVRGVINSIQVRGMGLEIDDQRFLQPEIGEQIYFRDGVSGLVERVIINPDNRRVVAMVLRGRYLKSQPDYRFQAYGQDLGPDQLIVIPMRAIRTLTKSSGFIRMDSTEAVKDGDFDPACFTTPGQEWTPPFPYYSEEVLFQVKDQIRS